MTDRERLIKLLSDVEKNPDITCPNPKNVGACRICKYKINDVLCDGISREADYLLEHGIIVPPETGIGDVSDGYHTFNELYHHRAVLFSVICNTFKDKAWKSKKHDTGDMYDGMFIVGIETPQGQATYHYDINPYWDMFKVKELPNAPKWDGHTPEEAIRRISILQVDNVIVPPCKVGDTVYHVFPKKGIQTSTVRQILIGSCGMNIFDFNGFYEPSDFGKTVFLTREEAEKALKERDGA